MISRRLTIAAALLARLRALRADGAIAACAGSRTRHPTLAIIMPGKTTRAAAAGVALGIGDRSLHHILGALGNGADTSSAATVLATFHAGTNKIVYGRASGTSGKVPASLVLRSRLAAELLHGRWVARLSDRMLSSASLAGSKPGSSGCHGK